MLNRIVIMGRLTKDPELRFTSANIPVCTITVAVDRDFARAGEQKECDFIDVIAWRQTGEFISKYFQKGRMIYVDGRLQSRKWRDKNDQPRVSFEIVADNVGFCGDKPADRREDTRYSDNPADRYGEPPAPRYAEPPRYSEQPRYSTSAAPAAASPAASPLPGVSDFSELEDEADDKVPF